MRFPIAIEGGDDNTAFGVVFPDVDGCFSAGDTLDEAIANAKEALDGYLELCFDVNDPVPVAKSIHEHRKNPLFKDCVWAVIDVDISAYFGKSKKVNVTLPELLIQQIDDVAASNPSYKTRSGFLAKAAMHELKLAM
jgi:predicted RNase H-like HicB family nuclease